MNFEKVNTNLIGLRGDLGRERVDRQKFEEKRTKLLKREERSLTGLRAATMNLRKIIGAASGASAVRSFSQGNIGEGLQETGIAIAAFLPEIIGITSNIVVGGLATKGLIGGGTGMAGAPKGKAGLLALPLLALAPLLMGAGKNNQGNAPTSEFRREQEVRRTRKNVISSGDTDRFGIQLDRFERILDNMGDSSRQKRNVNQTLSGVNQEILPSDLNIATDEIPDSEGFFADGRDAEGRDKEGRKNIQNQIADFLKLANPFKSIGDMFKSDEELMQDSKDNFQIFGTMWDGTKKMFNGIMNMFKPPEAKAGTLDEFLKDGGVLPNNNETNKNIKEVRNNLMNLSESFTMSDDMGVDFTSILGATPAALKGNPYELKKNVYALGALWETNRRSMDYAYKTWKKANLDPEALMDRARKDYIFDDDAKWEAMDQMAEVFKRDGKQGQLALYRWSKFNHDLSLSPWMRYGTNAMVGIDAFTNANIATFMARYQAYDEVMEKFQKIDTDALDAAEKRLYESFFDKNGLIKDKAVNNASGEVALNLDIDNPIAEGLNKMFDRMPISKMVFLPDRSGLSTKTCLSNLPGLKRAASSTSGWLVAARTMTGLSAEAKPSISVRS